MITLECALRFDLPQFGAFQPTGQQLAVHFLLRLHVTDLIFLGDLVQGRLSEINVSFGDQTGHLAVEERQEQGANVAAIHVRIGEDDNAFVIAFADVLVLADVRPHGGDDATNFVVGQHLFDPGLLDIEDLASQRQNRLENSVPPAVRRTSSRIAFDQEKLALIAILGGAIHQFSRQAVAIEDILPLLQLLSGACGGFAGLCCQGYPLHDLFGDLRVFLEEAAQVLVDHAAHNAFYFWVVEPHLSLALKLRMSHAHTDDRCQAFTEILPSKIESLFDEAFSTSVKVHRPRQGRAKTSEVRPTQGRMHVVDIGMDAFLFSLRVLEGHLDPHSLPDFVDVDRLMQRGFIAIEPLDELDDAAVVAVTFFPAVPFIGDLDGQAFVEEGKLTQPARQGLEVEGEVAKDFWVRFEGDPRARSFGDADFTHLTDRDAAFIILLIDLSVAAHFNLEPLAQSIDCFDTDAVQPRRHGINVFLELAARSDLAHHQFQSVASLSRVHTHRDPATIVRNRHAAVHANLHVDVFAEARHRLIHAVMHQLVNEVMQPAWTYIADIHTWIGTHMGRILQHLNVLSGVGSHLVSIRRLPATAKSQCCRSPVRASDHLR
ncbi:hypothetical protein HRbin36_01124 [bacterium HR36]|nr:hypothetical protein HRbin36_01124 [bacterium HR36]